MDNGQFKAEKELIHIIDEFLNMCEQTRKENIADYVYLFFAPHGVKVGTKVFSTAAASALCAFSTNKKMRKFIEALYGDDFYFLCELLQKVVEFCNSITSSEANLARLDKSKWECYEKTQLSLEDVLEEKCKYEHKLKMLSQKMKRIKS